METEQLLLPDGSYVEIPIGWSDEEKQKFIEEQIQKQNVVVSERSQDKGMLADWKPEGAATSWLYDVGVVAPYEASRKFINSTISLTEDLGDTLGEKSNLGGFRYGKEADNNFFEYVPYDKAIKLGNVKGILAPITGNVGVNDARHIKGFFYDPDKINPEDATETLTASFVEGGVQFLLGWVTAQKTLKGLKAAKTASMTEKIGKASATGAIADFIGFDDLSGRLTDMIVEHYPSVGDTWVGYLQSDPDDEWWEARMKNTLEGLGLGVFTEVLFAGLRSAKGYISKNMDERLLTKDAQIISEAQEAIIKSKGALDQATTISEKMAIMNKSLDNVQGLKKPKLKLTTGEKIQFLKKITQEDLNVNFEKYKKGELSAEEAFSLPSAWINLDTFDEKLITKDFIQTIRAMHEAVEGGYDKVSRDFSHEVIQRKAINEYGGEINRIYKDYAYLSKSIENTAPLIYAHEMMLYSLIKALPNTQRNVVAGVKGFKQSRVDDMLAYIFAMQKNRAGVASNTGGNLQTLGIAKKELERATVIGENLQAAIDEFAEFARGSTKAERNARKRFLDKVATLDNPSAARYILNFVGKNRTWEVLNEVWINSLLSNPKTQLVNLVGNAITAMARPIEDKLGANISAYLSSKDIGRVARYNELSKEAGATFAGIFQNLSDAVKLGGKAFKQGDLILEGSGGMSKVDTATTKATGSGWFGETIRLPSRALNAGDEVFKQINYRGKVQALAVTEANKFGLKGKEFKEFIRKYFNDSFDEFGRGTNLEALEYAREATYTNELTGMMRKFQSMINEYPFMKQLFPFIRTPFQLAKSVIDRSPVALTYRWRHILGQSNNAKMIAKTRGQLAMGGILFSSSYLLAKFGMLQSATNKTDDKWSKYIGLETSASDGRVLDKFKDAELMRLKKSELDYKPYSILINGIQIPFSRLDPYGIFFGLVADISTNYQYLKQAEIERLGADMQLFLFNRSDDNPISSMDTAGIALRATASAVRDNLLSKTYLQSLHEIVEAMFANDDRTVKRYFNNKLGSFYPNILSKIVNDPFLRDGVTLIEQIKKRTGLGEPARPRFNFMGKAHKINEGTFERLFNNMLSPVTATRLQKSVIVEEILRLGKAPPNLKKWNENVDFTKYKYKNKDAYWRLNSLLSTVRVDGVTFEEKLKELIQSDNYKSKTDPLKTDKTIGDAGGKYYAIMEIYDEFLEEAILQMEKEYTYFKHVDDDRRTLEGDIKKQADNKDEILSKDRTNERLRNKLKPLINF